MAARGWAVACTVCLALLACSSLSGARAQAAITHDFLPEATEALSKGVPAGEALHAGRLFEVNALTVDSGHVWVAERVEAGVSRVDAFDIGQEFKFHPPQLDEEGGVRELDQGVAVGHPGGEEEVYVGAAKGSEGVVAVYDAPSGKLLHAWTGASTPNGSFTQEGKGEMAGALTGVAVDGSASLETGGDVYVSTFGFEAFPSFNVVDVFKGEAGGGEPAEVAAQLKGTCAVKETTCPGKERPFKEPSGVAVSGFDSDVLVSDGKAVIDIFKPALLGEYEFVGQLTGTPAGPFGRVAAVAVDGADGDIYVIDQAQHAVDEFDAQGRYLTRLTGTAEGSPFHVLRSVAIDPGGDVYVGDFNETLEKGFVDVFGPNLVVPDVRTKPPGPVTVSVTGSGEGEIEAKLNGSVNPLGEGPAKCRFAWGASRAFGQLAPCEGEEVPEGNAAVLVHAKIKQLAPDTLYFYRLQASNHNGTNLGEEAEDAELLTPGPGIHGLSASDVAATSATLGASIDPHGAPTSYYFQYGKSTAYEAQVPAAPGAPLGEGEGDVRVAPAHIQGLAPNTLYHYRVVAVSALEVAGEPASVSFPAADQTFTTQGAPGPAPPDGRRWELVSPADKHGALLQPIRGNGVIQAAGGGGALSYLANLPTEEQVKGYIFEGVQVLATRGAGGWSSQDISLPQSAATGLVTGEGHEYRFFSRDLCDALLEPFGEFSSLAPEAFPPDSENTPYVRHDCTCATAPASCFEPLLTHAPGYADVPAGTQFGGQLRSLANFVGATEDLSHVILSSSVALTATPTKEAQLYEWSAGGAPSEELGLISVPPGAEAAQAAAQLGFGNTDARGAISEDGARVVWSELGGHPHLYMRAMASPESVQLDVPEAQCLAEKECGGGESGPRFQLASSDGSRVLFSDSQPLRKDSGVVPGQADLYECEIVEVAGKLSCELSDLTPAPASAADVQGLAIGASEDGEWVYFVANGVLGDGAAHGAVAGDCKLNGGRGEGQCNLYVRHDGATHLIAVLSGEDAPDWSTDLGQLTARVSPDGRWLAFMSKRPLTGYDNHDAVSGEPDEEVFLYHAESSGGGSLVCASCDPSGARPVGVEYAKLEGGLVSHDAVWQAETWLAANVPGWTPYRLAYALHQSRYLSDSGRLFFNSSDALVSQDINHDEDVYQFEPAGVGDCTSSSPTFSAASGGCVGLVSSGRAAGESAFLDASQSGDDVFFLSPERLVAKDVDTALDVYDAHVCASGAPCFEESEEPPPCTTAEACRQAPTRQPSIFGSPSSATFSGQGNLAPSAPPKPPPLTNKQKLAKALAACRHRYRKAKKRRVSCERQAKRRYGAKPRKSKAGRKTTAGRKASGGARR